MNLWMIRLQRFLKEVNVSEKQAILESVIYGGHTLGGRK